MASVTAVRAALRNRLATVTNLNAYARVPGTIVVPAALVIPGDPVVVYDSAMSRGVDDLHFVVRVLVQYADPETAEDALDAYLAGAGPSSIKTVLEADPHLGGVADFVEVPSVGGYGAYSYNDQRYLGVDFAVAVSVVGA